LNVLSYDYVLWRVVFVVHYYCFVHNCGVMMVVMVMRATFSWVCLTEHASASATARRQTTTSNTMVNNRRLVIDAAADSARIRPAAFCIGYSSSAAVTTDVNAASITARSGTTVAAF
jgi:hypothetical protein